MRVAAALLVAAGLALPAAPSRAAELTVAEAVASYVAARGGAERWRALEALEITGIYAAFSFHEPFRLIRKRGDLYRLDYVVLGSPAIRARDAAGPWGQDPLLQPAPAHIAEDPYKSQLERESWFEPPLLDYAAKGITVELIGAGEVDGTATVDLRLVFADEREEIWHLDADSWLEVAIDARVFDYTQGTEPMRRRTFFDDFRELGGLVLPFQVDHEFGARLEAMTVEEVRIDPPLDAAAFAAPPPAVEEAGEQAPAADPADGSP